MRGMIRWWDIDLRYPSCLETAKGTDLERDVKKHILSDL